MSLSERIALGLGLLGCTASVGAAQGFSCPSQITAPPALAASYPGWTAWASPRPVHFDQIAITSGHPDDEATLVPDIETKKQVGWRLQQGREHWAVCRYDDSNMRLIQLLPQGLRQCVVTLKPVGRRAVQQMPDLRCD